MIKIKHLWLFLIMSLTACGGGGGGGAVNSVTNFVQNTVSELSGSEQIVQSYSNTLSNFNQIITNNELASLSAITNPNAKTRDSATKILGVINNAEQLWSQTLTLIESQSADKRKQIYNSNSYKDAYAAYLYLKNTVKPIVNKVAAGQGISDNEYNKVADDNVVVQEVNQHRSTTVVNDVSQKLTLIEEEKKIDQQEEEKKEVTVLRTETLSPTVTISKEEGETYTITTYIDGSEQTTITNGESVDEKTSIKNVVDQNNNDGTITRKTYLITTTKTTIPVTTTITFQRTYTDVVKQDITITTTTTPNIRTYYSDGSYIDSKGKATTSTKIEVKTLSTSNRVSIITKSSTVTQNQTSSSDAPGVLIETVTFGGDEKSYTDLDPNLGVKTPGYVADKSYYEGTSEYKSQLKSINASSAYARGWTGKGAKVAVADTGYDLDHVDLQGQVFATKDYTGTGMNDNVGHGTHVLGTIVAKKNDTGIHGVAFDATAAVIKVGDSSFVSINNAANGFSWAADQGAIVGSLSANSNYDAYFKKNYQNKGNGIFLSTDNRYDYTNGQFYNLQDANDYWKSVTDKGMIVVNSAGNQGLPFAAHPGYLATQVDSNGNLVLGGKMIIVGAAYANAGGGYTLSGYSNKAGHLCQQFNEINNVCNDKYKVSDFYIMAPGSTYSTSNDGGVGTMTGTSMAAPMVTGGIAVIAQMWPYMKGENLTKLILETANKNFSGYQSYIHGQGMLDLDNATKPQGAIGIPTSGKTTSSASKVDLSNSGGSGPSISSFANLSQLQNIMIIDSYDRDYYVNLSTGLKVKDNRKISDVNATINNKNYLSFQNQYGNFTQGTNVPLPYGFELGLLTGQNGDGDWTTHFAKNFEINDKLKFKISTGLMEEQNTWLGNFTDGALATGKNNQTKFAQLDASYLIGNSELFFKTSKGYTNVNTVSNSLIKNFNTLETSSIKLGLEKKLNEHKKWGISYSIPNYISKGSSNLSIPYATTSSGEVLYDDVNVDMSQQTKEKDLAIYFSQTAQSETDWNSSFSLEYRQNMNGEVGEDKIVPTFAISKKFYGACVKIFGMVNNKPFCKKIRAEKKLSKLEKNKIKNKNEILKLKQEITQLNNLLAKG